MFGDINFTQIKHMSSILDEKQDSFACVLELLFHIYILCFKESCHSKFIVYKVSM